MQMGMIGCRGGGGGESKQEFGDGCDFLCVEIF